MSTIRSAIVQQFGKPSGPLGVLAGLVMRMRPSNRLRNSRTLDLLGIQPKDRVLEVGFGPGVAVARAAALAPEGKVVGVDHSELMLRQARRRNAKAISAGRVELILGSADALPRLEDRFDKVMAVNVYMFWKDPVSVLRGLRQVMSPGGVIALTLQPRRRGATMDDTRVAAEGMSADRLTVAPGDARASITRSRPS